jgi:hypothetical protein
MASILKRREIPVAIAGIIGIVLLLAYFVKYEPLQTTASTLTSWGTVLTGLMLAVGLINLCIVHGNRVVKREKGMWPFSLWLLVSMFGTIIIGIWAGVPWSRDNEVWQFLYTYVNTPISQTIFSLFGFYVISASIHALRARSFESMLFLISGLVVFFWAAPIGSAIWPGFANLGDWFMATPTAGVYRGILLGISLGLISFGIRVIIGQERGYLKVRE